MMYDEDPKIAYEFAQLPYKNKICFVPFETNVDSLFYINFRKRMSDKPFWQIVNMLANNTLELYNPIDLLKGENTMFEAIYYEVASIDGDYANLRRIDDPSADIKLVARALLPAEIMEGTKLKYELMQYEIC